MVLHEFSFNIVRNRHQLSRRMESNMRVPYFSKDSDTLTIISFLFYKFSFTIGSELTETYSLVNCLE